LAGTCESSLWSGQMIKNFKSERMNTRYIFIIALFLICFRISAQPPEIAYLGTPVTIVNGDDEFYGPFNIGFNFTFYGNVYSQFYISSNGMITFGAGSDNPVSVSIPNTDLPNNYIAPFWDDLVVDPSGKILYTTFGSVGNKKLVVQFLNMGFYTNPVFMGTFQVILYETSNIIQIQYRQIVDANSTRAHGATATIGLENATGTGGVLYAYHNPTAITPEQAISFTPSAGPSYTVNSAAAYDGIYLTTNLTLPGPGITNLIGPPENAVIGSDYTFEWSAATYATSYKLYISNNSDLSGAISYDAGSNLTYDITGLTLDVTYYWGVFAKNATGTSWCEIQKFTTSSTPPLVPVPQTIWIEQSHERTIKLNYTGGDASIKTGIITSLPAQGQLYQYNAGVKGSTISSVPTTLTDPGRNVIYAASGTIGNGAGNFNFKIHDDTGDSPAGLVTVNVNPPEVPNLLYAAKNTYIEIQIDRIMNDPAGKQSQFSAKVNGSAVTITALSLKTGDPYTIILTLAVPLTGTETVLLSYTQGDVSATTGGLLATFVDQPVNLLAQTISFPTNLSKKYGDPAFALSATASSGLGMTYSSSELSVATISTNMLTIHYTGTSDITARQAGNSTYAPANYFKPLTVAKGDQTIIFNPLPAKTYGEADFSPGATSSSGLSVSYTSDNPAVATIVSSNIHIVGAGIAVITASQSGNTLWNPAADVIRTLTVSQANQTITFDVLPEKTYGDADFSPGASASSGLTVSYSSDNPLVATIVSGMIHITGGGTAVITASQTGNTNFSPAADAPQTLTVNKAALTATADNKNKTYGDANPSLTITYTGFIGTDDETVLDIPAVATTTALQYSNAGTYPIVATGGSDNSYILSYTDGILTVGMTPLIITADNKNKTYGDANPLLTVSYTGFLGTDDQTVLDVPPDVTTTALQLSDAGNYPIVASGGSDNNYTLSYTDGSLTIGQAPLMATANNKNKTYGDPNPPLTITYSGFVGTDDETVLDVPAVVTTTALQYSDAGNYPIVASGGSDNNYTFTYNDGSLTIGQAPLMVTANNKNKTYGDPNPPLTVSYTGFLGTDDQTVLDVPPDVTTTALQYSDAGNYPIVASGGSDNNYTLSYTDGSLTIGQAPLMATANNKNKTYGDPNPPLTITYSGFVGTDDETVLDVPAVVTTTALQYSDAGTYPIAASGGSDNNYTLSYSDGSLTISKATLTFTADDLSKMYMAQNPELTYTISGFINGETESVLDALPAIQTTAVQNSPQGDYPITITGGNDNNYNYLYVDGTLTVNGISQTITFSAVPVKLLVGDTYTLVATSSAGLTVLYESMDIQKATVTGAQVTGVSKGNVQIRAYNPGDINYAAAETFATVEIYSTHKDIMYLFTPNNDGFNDQWELPDLATWGKCDVKVYNRWGKLVFADANYNNLWDGTSNGSPLPEGPYYFVIKTENAGMVKGTVNIVR
jgi:gliding motility-associated-like protein